ncbi:MAG: putative selenate reductase subunit YgfK [Acidobacteria bacterium]|nr:putative selenate reductase subunit YgfK [Acidobacteriota bacterium]
MEKAFRPAPLERIAHWIFDGFDSRDTILGIPKRNFQVPDRRFSRQMFGRTLSAPLGVAAGPHTQLSQNIVASWLCGARFIELKTVQVLDELEISRPCIDAADETYNCEWSQELKLEQSFDEYLNAWVLVHALAHKLGLDSPGMLFAMSVGYNLEGIQSARVQHFIASMRDAGSALDDAVRTVARVYPAIRDIDIPKEMSNHITLSTMHGCPPAEIERIARFLLTETGVHTWVKLNPTLLGADVLRPLLNETLGFDIDVPDIAFAHDPRFDDAMAMVRNLEAVAKGRDQTFGLKLSNTLEVVNKRRIFPPNEKMMYLSGRALHPLTLRLAAMIDTTLGGTVAISFCGGADARNFSSLVADGLSPVTVCTDLLKPGGYARLQQYLVNLADEFDRAGASSIDAYIEATSAGKGAAHNLAEHARIVADDTHYSRRERPLVFKDSRRLGHFDCIAPPCQEACPTHQNIPDYIWHIGHGEPGKALDVILRTNPQPGVTGCVCDRPCVERCVRNFYDAPVAIRELKRYATEEGAATPPIPKPKNGIPVAVVGAGPAGLSAAYYLALAGFSPEIFEAKESLGGMVSGVIPGYRLDASVIEGDLSRVKELGVPIHLGKALGSDISLDALRKEFPYVFLGVGAQKGKRLGIPGETTPGVIDALDFLEKVNSHAPIDLGTRVLIIGGGNSAMDAARSARRLVSDGDVTIVYRRTRAEMPADAAEVHDCIEENIGIRPLLAPDRVAEKNGRVAGLVCKKMRLGEPDASGRPRPIPIEGSEEFLVADTIITAISQDTILDFLGGLDARVTRGSRLVVNPATSETSIEGLFAGGDAVHGPDSIIQAIADGRFAAEEIARRHGISFDPEPVLDKHVATTQFMEKKSRQIEPQTVPTLPVHSRKGFIEVQGSFSREAAMAEAERCLDCDDVCSLCVTVCPNRANMAYATAPLALTLPRLAFRSGRLVETGSVPFAVEQSVQIVNIGDFCNECGNCTTFCPTSGEPYKDKPRFWIDPDGFREAKGDAFRLERQDGAIFVQARLGGWPHSLRLRDGIARYDSDRIRATLDLASGSLLDFGATGPIQEGEEIDLSPLATLVALLPSEPVLPKIPGDNVPERDEDAAQGVPALASVPSESAHETRRPA